MKITGEELLFLIQVLKDSLVIQMGYDWNFKHQRDEREMFYNNLLESIFTKENIEIKDIDVLPIRAQ